MYGAGIEPARRYARRLNREIESTYHPSDRCFWFKRKDMAVAGDNQCFDVNLILACASHPTLETGPSLLTIQAEQAEKTTYHWFWGGKSLIGIPPFSRDDGCQVGGL